MKQAGRSIYTDGIVTVGKTSVEPVDVIFSPGDAMVSGRIQDGQTPAIRPARVTLVPQGVRRSNPMFYVRATSTDGTFNLSGISQGEYKLFAFASLPGTVSGNRDALSSFRHGVYRVWWHALNRWTQTGRVSAAAMARLGRHWLPYARVLHPYPAQRFDALHPR